MPGATTCMRRIHRQTAFGYFQNACCMIEVKFSPASASAMTPRERKECMEKFQRFPAATTYALKAAVICDVKRGLDP